MKKTPVVRIQGARTHNLKDVDVTFPHGKLSVVTGVSGSGKSTLAFNTLYAEGQRRYVESFSPYARQFLERMDRPHVETIDGLLPAVAIEQRNTIRSARSTLASLTELTEHFKLLFANLAQCHCSVCGAAVLADSSERVADDLLARVAGQRLSLGFPFHMGTGQDAEVAVLYLAHEGFHRGIHAGKAVPLEDVTFAQGKATDILVDRLRIDPSERQRLVEGIDLAYRLGENQAALWVEDPAHEGAQSFQRQEVTNDLRCCGERYPAPRPGHFSFNSALGACEECNGFGRTMDYDLDRVIPDPRLSLKKGAIKPWSKTKKARERRYLKLHCERLGIDMETPFGELPADSQRLIIDGEPGRGWKERWPGIRGWFKWLERKSYKMHVRVLLARYRAYIPCPSCRGTRFKTHSLFFRLQGHTIAEVMGLSVTQALKWLARVREDAAHTAHKNLLEQLEFRLGYLRRVGLGYLTLGRQARTLSGGEVQRAHLTNALGSGLVNTLFVLDEPSVGLHAQDAQRLAGFLVDLVDQENTVVLVEHDPELLQHADHVVEMGPGAGTAGGEVVYAGTPQGLLEADDSATRRALSQPFTLDLKSADCSKLPALTIRGARAQNLKNIDVALPLGRLTVITGVSGSGKSTLIEQVLHRGILRRRGQVTDPPGEHASLEGLEGIEDVFWVDQSPPSATPRANAATYVKAWDAVRKHFAKAPLARERGYDPGTFSFNSGRGRCQTCQGAGVERIEMQFLSDVYVTCPVCEGQRFRQEVLEVRVKGKSVVDVLGMTAGEARDWLGEKTPGGRKLHALEKVGLGYLRLGQSLSTLSGGEAQRLKLANHLGRTRTKNALFLFDEPTSGLHLQDVALLLENLKNLRMAGNTVVVIEHHLDVIAGADHIVDLGPKGGDLGGESTFNGPPRLLLKEASPTGQALRDHVAWRKSPTLKVIAKRATPTREEVISVEGARVHNLKNISFQLPRSGRTVVTGVSGSGKSSIAFDLVYAEGQRRFLDCLSSYARQYIHQLEKPDVDAMGGIPPTVAIEQRRTRGNPHSTVADTTEIASFLRLLFARCGVDPGGDAGDWQPDALARYVIARGGAPWHILAPAVQQRKGYHRAIFAKATAMHHPFIRVNGELMEPDPPPKLKKTRRHTLEYQVADVPAHSARDLERAITDAARLGGGRVLIIEATGEETLFDVDSERAETFRRSQFDPRLFSPHTTVGACPHCKGIGVDEDGDECVLCDGERLEPQGRRIRLAGRSYPELWAMTPGELATFLGGMTLDPRATTIAQGPVAALLERLAFLQRVGLEYLSLDRRVGTLSGGEFQRIRLASQLGAHLCGVLYVLDEPTIGLHPTDVTRLLSCLEDLEGRGNGILMVEHDETTIRWADRLIDVGPGAGQEGGEILVNGPVEDALKHPKSITGRCLRAPRSRVRKSPRTLKGAAYITLKDIHHHNLQGLNARLPRGRLTVVTGVSGSGKSTLVNHVLVRAVVPAKGGGTVGQISGIEGLKRVVFVDDKPIGKNSRSTPATYVGLFNLIRKHLSRVPEARLRGYGPGRFSFNVKGGRCEACAGQGRIKLEMSFLPNAYTLCDVCQGKRYNRQTLHVTAGGLNIHDILSLSVRDALIHFEHQPQIHRKLQLMADVGLGYLSLGQSSTTLSGGEAQRIKLVSELAMKRKDDALVILDEPTTGLHMADVPRLIGVLHRLVEGGATVVVIEHNQDVIREADYLIDMGPGPGIEGGQIVHAGTLKTLLKCPTSLTAQALRGDLREKRK